MKILNVFFSSSPLGGAVRGALGAACGVGLLYVNKYFLADLYVENHDVWLASLVVQMCALMAFMSWAYPRLENKYLMSASINEVIKEMEDPNRYIPFSRFIKKPPGEDEDKTP